jgi:hypothetical protein
MPAQLKIHADCVRRTSERLATDMADARARFEERFPEFQNKARAHFGDYTPEARDEAVANSLFLTWYHFASLAKNGRADEPMLTSVFYYSCRQTRSGRMMRTVKSSKSRELWDSARKGGHVVATSVDFDAFVSKRSNVPDIVAFRVDTKKWLDSLTEKQRRRALELAEGNSTKELSLRWKVSGSAVSLYRRQLNESYERFISR